VAGSGRLVGQSVEEAKKVNGDSGGQDGRRHRGAAHHHAGRVHVFVGTVAHTLHVG